MINKFIVGNLLVAGLALRSICRNPFFWVWLAITFLLVLSLHHITFFDFEEGSVVTDLFLATVTLSGAVISVVFFMGDTRRLARGQWDLLLTRPVQPIQILLGRYLGLMTFQAVFGAILAGVHFFDSWLVEVPVAPSFWIGWYLALLQTGVLAAFYSLITVWTRGYWALSLMVGAYLLGHLSEQIPPGFSLIGTLVFCVLPDLNLSMSLGGGGDSLWKSFYAASYIALTMTVSSWRLQRAA